MGDLQCVVAKYLALKGLGRSPDWLVQFQNAFALSNRKAGKCEAVAKAIHYALTRFRLRPEFVRITVQGESRLLGFDEVSQGTLVRTHQVATMGHHVAVKLGDKILDAYTGPAGLTYRDYVSRLVTAPNSTIAVEVVEKL